MRRSRRRMSLWWQQYPSNRTRRPVAAVSAMGHNRSPTLFQEHLLSVYIFLRAATGTCRRSLVGIGSVGAGGRRTSRKSIGHLVAHAVDCVTLAHVAGGHAMKFLRRQFLHLAAGAAALPAVSRT